MMPSNQFAQSGSVFAMPAVTITRDGKNPGWTPPDDTDARIDELLGIGKPDSGHPDIMHEKKDQRTCRKPYKKKEKVHREPECESKVRGVSWNKKLQKWYVRLYVENKTVYLGARDTYAEAVDLLKALKKRYKQQNNKRINE